MPFHFGDWEYDHAELESTPKDSDLVGGARSPAVYVTASLVPRRVVLKGGTRK